MCPYVQINCTICTQPIQLILRNNKTFCIKYYVCHRYHLAEIQTQSMFVPHREVSITFCQSQLIQKSRMCTFPLYRHKFCRADFFASVQSRRNKSHYVYFIGHHTQYARNKKKKNLVWHSHNFLLSYITVEEYFKISTTFIFNLYFLCFVVDELPAFIIIGCNFLT